MRGDYLYLLVLCMLKIVNEAVVALFFLAVGSLGVSAADVCLPPP